MIYVIDARNRDQYGGYILESLRQRYQVFVKERGWHELESLFGLEADEYDSPLATYLLAVDDETGEVLGGLRTMSTMYGTVIGEKFSHYITDANYPDYYGKESWEIYRLYQTTKSAQRSGATVKRELMLSMIEYLLQQGAKRILAFGDAKWHKQLPPIWNWKEIGERMIFKQVGHEDGECAFTEIEINQQMLDTTKQLLKYEGSFLKRAEEGLPVKKMFVKPEQLYALNLWLGDHTDRVTDVRKLVAEAEQGLNVQEEFEKVLTEAISYNLTKPQMIQSKGVSLH